MVVQGSSLSECGFADRDLEEVALAAGWWLSSRTASKTTCEAYAADLGLPYLLAADPRGVEIAGRVESQFRVRLPVYAPGPKNTTWHLSFLPWLIRAGVADPWGPDVCRVVGAWGRDLAALGGFGDHVWSTDAQRVTPLSSAFIRRRATAVRSYYRFTYAAGLSACSPADLWAPRASGVPAQPERRQPVNELDRDDLSRLQVAADEHQGVAGDRELVSAVVAVLVATACRSVEVARCDVTDYRRSARRGPMVRLRGKGRTEMWVPLDEATAQRVDAWVMWRPDLVGATVQARIAAAGMLPHRVPLFCPVRGARGAVAVARREQEGHAGRLHPTSVHAMLRRVCARACSPLVTELAEWIHPHAIRAAVATDLLDEGVPIQAVQQMMRHASLTITARYDRRGTERHLPALTVSSGRQAVGIEQERKRALSLRA